MWVRVYRKGREKGGWVYLDADLLREAGVPPEAPLMVKRYALRPEGGKRARGRIMLNVAIVTETKDEEEGNPLLTRHRKLRSSSTNP
jgi:hypothetical protein